jgi:hypothetical protein
MYLAFKFGFVMAGCMALSSFVLGYQILPADALFFFDLAKFSPAM